MRGCGPSGGVSLASLMLLSCRQAYWRAFRDPGYRRLAVEAGRWLCTAADNEYFSSPDSPLEAQAAEASCAMLALCCELPLCESSVDPAPSAIMYFVVLLPEAGRALCSARFTRRVSAGMLPSVALTGKIIHMLGLCTLRLLGHHGWSPLSIVLSFCNLAGMPHPVTAGKMKCWKENVHDKAFAMPLLRHGLRLWLLD
jgi:hypothetical protein